MKKSILSDWENPEWVPESRDLYRDPQVGVAIGNVNVTLSDGVTGTLGVAAWTAMCGDNGKQAVFCPCLMARGFGGWTLVRLLNGMFSTDIPAYQGRNTAYQDDGNDYYLRHD